MSDQKEMLSIPCTLQKVTTLAAGGHRISFDAPETAAAHIRELIGRENNTVFMLCLVEADKIEERGESTTEGIPTWAKKKRKV